MPSFYCKAVHAEGHTIDEPREADDMETLVAELQRNGFVPIRISPTKPFLFHFGVGQAKKLNKNQLLVFTQELATLLQAGLPLDNALKIMLDLTLETPALNAVVDRVHKKVKQGVPLSAALEQQNCGCTTFYLGIIKAGEAAGDVAASLQQLSEYLERMEGLRSSIVSALVYPAILLVTSLASIILLMTLVLPQFVELFNSAGKQLPLSTTIVMAVSQFLQHYWWLLVLVFVGLLLALQHILQTPDLRYRWDKRCLALPIVGDLLKKIELARFSYTLGHLLKKGMPLLEALAVVKSTMSNTVIVKLVDRARQHLKQGRLMSSAFNKDDEFPNKGVQMIRLGEEAGNLQLMLQKLSQIYDQDVKVGIQRFMSLLEPIIILALGVVIAGIIFSVLIAIVSINDIAF
jgi:general secretion pathway protein F